MATILIIEDESVIRSALRRLLERHEYQVDDAGTVAEASSNFDLSGYDLIIADLRLPGGPGTDIIPLAEGVPVLIMTSYASVRSAVESMKMGAVDYIAKPFDHDELLLMVKRILQQNRLARQNQALKSDLSREYPIEGMVGECEAMRDVFQRVERVAPTDTTVLILGESGTGKELVARALHKQSTRADAPLITVNCAAIPESLIESELFGHEKGAFTGAVGEHKGLVEAADGGTLFLDEIGELPPAAQARLLRVLQDGEIRRVGSTRVRRADIRLVAATHRELHKRVDGGLFREDLFFRLRVMEIRLPPLRERGDDIPALANFLLQKCRKRLNRGPLRFSTAAMNRIRTHPWPGNVREMENAIERAVILSDGDEIGPELMALEPSEPSTNESASKSNSILSLDDYFRRFVLDNQDQMTETELARRLGISRKTLWERRQRLGVPRRK